MSRLLAPEETDAYLPLVMHGYFPPRPRVTLDPSVAVRNGAPGDVVTFPLALKNNGNIPDSFHVTLTTTGEPEWDSTVSPAETRTLQPDETVTVFVSVRIPTTAATGQTNIVAVIATSAVSSIARDTSVLAATVEHSPAGLVSDGCYPSSIARVRTGPQSREVALDAAGDRAFVAHTNGVSVIVTDSLAVIADIPLSIPVPDAGQSNSASLSPASELRLANYSPAQGIAYDPDNDRI